MSHSENKPKTTQTSSTQVTNINLQDTEGVTIVGDGNQVTSTDYGAINSAIDIGLEALQMGQTNLDTAASLAGRGLDTALDATRSALDFSDSVVRSNERVASDSIQRIADFGGVALGESLDFARDVFEGAGSALRNVTESNIAGLTSLAKQTSESADDRVSRTAMYAFAAIAAVFVLPALFGKAR